MQRVQMNTVEESRKLDDTAFNKISRFVTLQNDEIKYYNVLFKEVTEGIVNKLQEDESFKLSYRDMMYAGSFYKQTKVGKPEEFDVNLIINLPDIDKAIIEIGEPGFAKIKFKKDDLSSQWTENKILNKWLDTENYISNKQVRQWFESTSTKTLSSMKKNSNDSLFLPSKQYSNSHYEIKIKKSGPAFTLHVIFESNEFSIDLVPVLEFKRIPPLPKLKKFKGQLEAWYLVPKPLMNVPKPEQNWRYCFYKNEKTILKDNGKIKAVIRTIKKLRDVQDWKILCSYYIETLFYHELDSKLTSEYIKYQSQTNLLVHMLKKFRDALKKQEMFYFWDHTCNILKNFTEAQTSGVVNRMSKIIKDIESGCDNIYDYFLTSEELQKLGSITTDKSSQNTINIPLKVAYLGDSKSVKRHNSSNALVTTNMKITKTTNETEMQYMKEMILTLTEEVRLLQMTVKTLESKIDIINERLERRSQPTRLSGIQSQLLPFGGLH